MGGAFCEVPDEPGVYGSKAQFAAFRAFSGAVDVVEYPADFTSAEIGVGDQAGFFGDLGAVGAGFESAAIIGSAAVLPNDRIVDGFSRAGVPDDGGLSLVCDADGGDFFGAHFGGFERFTNGAELAFPNVLRVVFHPGWFWKVLGKFELAQANFFSLLIENDCTRRGRSSVDG